MCCWRHHAGRDLWPAVLWLFTAANLCGAFWGVSAAGLAAALHPQQMGQCCSLCMCLWRVFLHYVMFASALDKLASALQWMWRSQSGMAVLFVAATAADVIRCVLRALAVWLSNGLSSAGSLFPPQQLRIANRRTVRCHQTHTGRVQNAGC